MKPLIADHKSGHGMQAVPSPASESFRLAKSGDSALIPLVAENRWLSTLRDAKQKTLLMTVAERGHEPLIEPLLSLGSDPLATDPKGTSALIYSAFNNHHGVALALAPLSAVRHRNGFGWNALMGAAINGDVKLMHFLIQHGADTSDADAGGRNPLMKAVRCQKLAAVEYLAPLSPIDAKDVDMNTALLKASRYGYLDIARILLSFGANPLEKDVIRENCIDKALKHGHAHLASLLQDSLQ